MDLNMGGQETDMAETPRYLFSIAQEKVGKRKRMNMVIADPENGTSKILNFSALRNAGAHFFDNVVEAIVGSEHLRRLASKEQTDVPITPEHRRQLFSAYAVAAMA